MAVISLLLANTVMAQAQSKLMIYPAPEGVLQNTDFSVKVRLSGQPWQELDEYLLKVDEVRGTSHSVENSSMSTFDFSGEIEVSVTSNKGEIQSARVRPLSYGIMPDIQGNTLTFKLSRPRNLSIEVNGDIFHNLQLFANPIDEFVPDKKDTNLIYFGPGIHQIEGGKFQVKSGETVYLAGGAVLMGQVLFEGVSNAKLLGRGVIDHSVKMGVYIAYSKNITVEGIVCTQCATGGSDSVTIRNVKSISYYGWGDGMNVFASNNVLFDGVFCRNSDDCTTVYATRKGFVGGCKNIVMQNSTLWADVAHPILIGTHGNTEHPDVIENIRYSNIDILDHREMQIDYQGCLAVNAGDNNLVRNVVFEDIRIEDFREGQLVNLRVFFNSKYCTSPGRGIDNVLFKNISYNGTHAGLSVIAGYNEERKVKNVVFENLVINGMTITDDMPGKPAWYKTSDMARIFVGEHVEGIEFRK
ncbi:glycosyl hydrolase family 28 protein [Gaoshiqia sp. Z1-71]|uniref:glycosyl hydrolase family 28 protein n=1 Tax=Gaoshiqia hydrogeniformans TaxID=3290090 RepID=UPI003BF7D529